MDSTRPIRALLRGLDALAALNRIGGATVSELVADIRLPRTTVYRVLETLCAAGYVRRDTADDRYRLTQMVRALGDAFDEVALLAQAGEAQLAGLTGSLGLPAGFATLSGTTLRLRERAGAGADCVTQHPALATSACGLAYLAHCPAEERDALLAAAGRVRNAQPLPADLPDALLRIASQGYALAQYGGGGPADTMLAVPVAAAAGALGVLTVRIAPGAISRGDVVERFVPALQACAGRVGNAFVEQRAGTCRTGVPATAH